MITIACLTCYMALRLSGEHDEVDHLVGTKSEWYPNRYPCPRSGCGGVMTITDAVDAQVLTMLEIHDLNPQEVFQALQGMGLPAERACTEGVVRAALTGRSITSMDLQPLRNTMRSVLHSFTLDDGTRVYLGSSPYGAVVYRVAPPRSVVRELTNGS